MVTLGVDVGGTATKWVVLDGTGDVRHEGSVPTPTGGPEAVLELIGALCRQYEKISGVGVGVPGNVDVETGRLRFVPNVAGDWAGFPLAERVAAATGRPSTVVNDARAFALAELRHGAARGWSSALFVVLGTGVGGAIAIDGRVLRNATDSAGEIGHLTVEPAGRPCGCGHRGCLETLASGPALGGGATAEAALAGDEHAAHRVRVAGWALGTAIGSALALLGLRTVVIGGGVAAALPLLRPDIEAELAGRTALLGECEVREAALGVRAGAIGAALWAT